MFIHVYMYMHMHVYDLYCASCITSSHTLYSVSNIKFILHDISWVHLSIYICVYTHNHTCMLYITYNIFI